MNNEQITQFLAQLVETKFGGDLDADEKREATEELEEQTTNLFNTKIVTAFDVADYDELEKYIETDDVDAITRLAEQRNVDVTQILTDTLTEVARRYVG